MFCLSLVSYYDLVTNKGQWDTVRLTTCYENIADSEICGWLGFFFVLFFNVHNIEIAGQ